MRSRLARCALHVRAQAAFSLFLTQGLTRAKPKRNGQRVMCPLFIDTSGKAEAREVGGVNKTKVNFTMLKKTSLSDIPSGYEVNDFGTERYVNGLIKFIERSAAPITIALQGEWGSGKTSLMNKLRESLCGIGRPFLGISVNTWEYSMLATPEVAVIKILEYLIKALSADDPKPNSMLRKFANFAGFLTVRGGLGALNVATGGFSQGVTDALIGKSTDTESAKDDEISLSDLRAALNTAIKNSLKDGKRGVIVFVDDLDRLNPPLAVEILELLKNIFTLDNCIFILAIDYDVVVKGLKPKFGELTDKNEREFRSFFDKIIQVPFSLPVNNYRPMDFVMNSLVDIGYIKDFDKSNPNVRDIFTKIVNWSVGKNPRSIKRLINTLSLLDCIAQSSTNHDNTDLEMSLNDKVLNFIVVAIQITYPRIYRMLANKASFTSWDAEFAIKMGITFNKSEGNDSKDQWEEILEAACAPDSFLTQHLDDIEQLLNLIIDILGKTNQSDKTTLGKKMEQILDKTSATGVDSGFKTEDLDKKDLIGKLHRNVVEYINKKRPDISHMQLKRNTGNGGIYIWYDKDDWFDVTFTPSINSKKQIALRLWLDFHIARPERLVGLTFDEIMEDQAIREPLQKLDSVLARMLGNNTWFFNGRTYENNETYFPTYIEELRFIHNKGWMSGDITNNPQYWIDLEKPSHFEDKQIIATIGDVLIANYEFRKAMKDWK